MIEQVKQEILSLLESVKYSKSEFHLGFRVALKELLFKLESKNFNIKD